VTQAALAVDAGQTEIRAALTGERGLRTATAPGVLRLGGGTGPDEVAAGLVAAVTGLGALPAPVPPAAIGLSGFEAASERDLRRVHELLRRELGLQQVAIASDGLTSLLGALGDRPGAVVAAGTGTVCVARDGERMAKVDGWGSLLGDAGSGFAIGRAGLDAALRRLDGRGGSAALLAAAERRFPRARSRASRPTSRVRRRPATSSPPRYCATRGESWRPPPVPRSADCSRKRTRPPCRMRATSSWRGRR
jgi:N-acetylglucosamine kinase-like BadF-type ATPase